MLCKICKTDVSMWEMRDIKIKNVPYFSKMDTLNKELKVYVCEKCLSNTNHTTLI